METLGAPTTTREVDNFTVKGYNVKKLPQEQGPALSRLLSELTPLGLLDEGEALGYFNGATEFHVAFQQDKPVAVHMKGETEEGESFDETYPSGHPAFSAAGTGLGGKRRSRLHKQARRTKRNRRNLKHRKLRKLSTRRR